MIDTSILWTYKNSWVQITSPPQNILFTLEIHFLNLEQAEHYMLILKKNRYISIWDDKLFKYVTVADAIDTINEDDISSLFLVIFQYERRKKIWHKIKNI